MVNLSEKHKLILYILIKYFKKLNKMFEDKPLEASVSKIDFIKFLKSLQIVEKSERGLYKNLEILQKKRLIRYENRFLKLTDRGFKVAIEKEKDLLPYLRAIVRLEGEHLKPLKSVQTYFK